MPSDPDPPRLRSIFTQWLPLAATWLRMGAEGPFLAAVIARMAEPKINLAAYGVAFSFALIIEAPIIMMMSAATALVKDDASYTRLRNFSYALNGVITAGMLFFLIPTVFFHVTRSIIGLPEDVAVLTHHATISLLPWPAAIGFRRFWHGILINQRLTRRIAYGTMIRMTSIASVALLLAGFTGLNGAVIGAISLSAAVIAEAVVSRSMTAASIRRVRKAAPVIDASSATYRAIARFYFPLALTSLLALGVQPMITFFIGRSRFPIESLAILPVINSLVFIFRSSGLSFQEVAIANMGASGEGHRKLRSFALILGSAATGALALISFTPLADFWLATVSGLSEELVELSSLPLMIQTALPAASVLLAFQHAVLVNYRKTTPITWGTMIEVAGIITTLAASIYFFDAVGAIAASIALLAGRFFANVFLARPIRRVRTLLAERRVAPDP